jgi:hypothetical protein
MLSKSIRNSKAPHDLELTIALPAREVPLNSFILQWPRQMPTSRGRNDKGQAKEGNEGSIDKHMRGKGVKVLSGRGMEAGATL